MSTYNKNTVLILKGMNLSEKSKTIFPSTSEASLSKITDVNIIYYQYHSLI